MEQPKPPDLPEDLDGAEVAEPEPANERDESLGGDDFEDVGMPSQGGEVGAGPEGKGLTDMLRRAMVAGLGAVFMTEEGIRTYVKDLKLPKDVRGFVVGQAERSKSELFRVIGEELRRFFESEMLRRELTRLLSQMTLDVHAEIRLKPAGELGTAGEPAAPRPEVKLKSATVRRSTPVARKRKKR